MADQPNDGGAAFPLEEEGRYSNVGMSLRDYFAGQALMGLAAFSRDANGDNKPEHFARWSYALADAMIAHTAQENTA